MTRDQLKEFLNILGVRYNFNDYRGKKRNLKNVVIECPFAKWTHDKGVDRHLGNASIRVNKLPHLFHCFSCKTGSGPLNIMVKKLREFGFDNKKCNKLQEILESVGELNFNLMSSFSFEEDDEDEFNVLRMSKYSPPSSDVYNYLNFRGVDTSLVDKYEIQEDDCYMTLPLKNNNDKIVGVAKRLIRDIEGKRRWDNEDGTKSSMCLYGEQFAKAGDDIIIVEGQIDVLYLDSLIPGAIPLGLNGSNFSEYQEFFLKRMGSLTIMTDNDRAGKRVRKNIKNKLSNYIPLMFKVDIPKEYGDPANTPKDVLVECFRERQPFI